MCQRLYVDGKLIETAQGLVDLVGIDGILVYGENEAIEPFKHDGSTLTYCLCPFALRETMERAGYRVECDELGDIDARKPEELK